MGRLKRVVYYPTFAGEADLFDCLSRAAWYLTPVLHEVGEVTFGLEGEAPSTIRIPADFDPAVAERLRHLLPKCRFRTGMNNDALRAVARDEADILLRWRMPDEAEDKLIEPVIAAVQSRGRVYTVDRDRSRNEGSFYLWLASHCFPEHAASLLAQSKEAFARMAPSPTRRKAYVFGTGPSLSAVRDHDFSDGDCIVANSIIQNKPLMRRLKPKILVAADPIFHGGCSVYAAEFRAKLPDALDDFPEMWLVVPMRDYHIYKSFLSRRHFERVVGVPFLQGEDFNIDLRERFEVKPVANVLTLFLLPLAATFYQEISVVGCDGRPESEDKYFWTHDPASQFVDKMQAIQQVHPAFFKRSYNDYYKEHCTVLDELVRVIEQSGKTVNALTQSYIPALRSRPAAKQVATGAVAHVVSLNPDITSTYGHYLGYEDKLWQAFRRHKVRFTTLCNTQAREELLEDRSHFVPALSVYSYRIGNFGSPGPATEPPPSRVQSFRDELTAAIGKLRSSFPHGDLALYFYYGSFYHAEVILDLVRRTPGLRALVNLEWLTFADLWTDDFMNRWVALLDGTREEPRMAMTVTTLEMQQELSHRTGTTLPIAPHPSVTFTDADFFALRAEARFGEERPEGPCRVVFPGLLRKQKGYDVTARTIEVLAQPPFAGQFRCVARDVREGVVPAEITAAAEKIAKYAETVKGALSNEQFLAMIRNAHIFVLPYQVGEFARRTSGLIIDAMYPGVPVVVLRGTWLAGLAERHGFGRIVDGPDPELLAGAVADIWENYREERVRALRAGGEWFKSNSWEALAGSILSGT